MITVLITFWVNILNFCNHWLLFIRDFYIADILRRLFRFQTLWWQVGFVLSDRYGRQSDVILSSYDSGGDISGSTVFNAYNNLTEQTNSPIVDWLGNALNVTLNEAIQSTYNPSLGTPGIYSSSNPLGWFSYKVVVKQTEQEYYNAYLPGFVNGYPVQENSGTERNKSFFTTLLGDNINKIPRNLVEVGASDRDFTSSEDILIRVNNPNIVNKPPAGLFYDQPYNTQYYPGNIEQEIIQISTVRDMEIAAIPFKPNVNGGEYGKSGITNIYNYDEINKSSRKDLIISNLLARKIICMVEEEGCKNFMSMDYQETFVQRSYMRSRLDEHNQESLA
mgnify:CR=1 FL=1